VCFGPVMGRRYSLMYIHVVPEFVLMMCLFICCQVLHGFGSSCQGKTCTRMWLFLFMEGDFGASLNMRGTCLQLLCFGKNLHDFKSKEIAKSSCVLLRSCMWRITCFSVEYLLSNSVSCT
jgi:hypothetical protein